MRSVTSAQFNPIQLISQKTAEVYSLSEVVSELLGSKQLFFHHDLIEPGRKSSSAHRHTFIEEVTYVVKGTATVVEGEDEIQAQAGAFILFDPIDKKTHFIENRTDQNLETLTFSITSEFDSALIDQNEDLEKQAPEIYFDKNLRELPINETDWIKYLEALKEKLKYDNHPAKSLTLLEKIGIAARILLRFDEAEFFLKRALVESYGYPSQNRLIQNLIRLAHVYQWKNEFQKSHTLFSQAKKLIDEKSASESLQAAYHQHLGKLYFDEQYFGKAQAEFSTSLSIREKISAPRDQIESSKQSLKEALKRWGRDFSIAYVRKAIPKDAEEIHDAHMRSIQEICSKDYSEKEIQAWGDRPFRQDQRVASIKNDLIWVIENNSTIQGYGHLKIFEKNGLKRAHILGLYLTRAAIGRSFGKAILDLMIEEIQSAKVKLISLESTITAQSFYHKAGFVNDGAETSVEINGMPIRCFPMSMKL